ncbi:hypothetical protein C8D88_101260 [Lentzea atacamensis]|uniref:Uncharacterized protein n=2 Tax=Lentzea TaxID=165301 RepID=A0A316IIX6_9PSEU|nr:hypothetical protein [Lentzea atacamensis]PWK90248.1 hypothetical protein C8D88_101260 [Lentzea atacamensis]
MRRLTVLALLCCLSACSTSDDTVEDLADRITADLEALPGAKAVSVEHSADMDHRQRLRVSATVEDKAKADEAMEIVKRDYWTGTGRRVEFRVRFTSPAGAELVSSDVRFKLGDLVEMERKYGPRSTAGELDPGR